MVLYWNKKEGSPCYTAAKSILIYARVFCGWQNWQAIKQHLAEVISKQNTEGVLQRRITDFSEL